MIILSDVKWLQLNTGSLGRLKAAPTLEDPRIIAAVGLTAPHQGFKSLLLVQDNGWFGCTTTIDTVMKTYAELWVLNAEFLDDKRQACAQDAGLSGQLPQVIVSLGRAWWGLNPHAREPLYLATPAIGLVGWRDNETKLDFGLAEPRVQGTIMELATKRDLTTWLKIAQYAVNLQVAVREHSDAQLKSLLAERGEALPPTLVKAKYLSELKQPQLTNVVLARQHGQYLRRVNGWSPKSIHFLQEHLDESFTKE